MIEFDKTIICASKYFNSEEIIKINKLGISNFGENRVEDLLIKEEILRSHNFTWHFIGHLQTNKIKKVINNISYLHSLSSIKQANLINKYRNESLKCFIQLNISSEDSKNGISIENIDEFILELKKYDKIEIVGFMVMGVNSNDELTEKVFIKAQELTSKYNFKELSMGMTSDYQLAIKHNATMLRIGSYFKELI